MTIFGTVTGKKEIKNGWEFELNIKLNFFIISTLGTQSDGNCTTFFSLLLVRPVDDNGFVLARARPFPFVDFQCEFSNVSQRIVNSAVE